MLRLWSALGRPASGRFLLSLSLSALAGAFAVGLLGLSGWFLTAAATAGAAGAGLVFNYLFPSVGVRAFAFGRVLARYGEQVIGHGATFHLSSELRPVLFERQALASAHLNGLPAAELSVLIDDVEAAEGGFLRVFAPTTAVIASGFVAVGFATASDVLLGSVVAITLVVVGGGLPAVAVLLSRARAQGLAIQRQSVRGDIANLVENAVELDVVAALPRLARQAQEDMLRLDRAVDALEKPFRLTGAANTLAGGALAFALLARAAQSGSNPALAAGAALAVIAAFEACGALAKVLDTAPRARASAARLLARLGPSSSDAEPDLSMATPLTSVLPVRAEILVVAPAADAAGFGPVSFTCGAASVLEISGKSGSGKTTLLETIARLRQVRAGSLSYAGVASPRVRSAAVLAHAALAPQFAGFLPGTLRDALRMGRPDASDALLREALAIACVEEAVFSRADGLDCRIGGDADGFSGGELRRLGLARALVANPELLLLDEPFAGLEHELAAELAAKLSAWALARKRALVVVSHEAGNWTWAGLSLSIVRMGEQSSQGNDATVVAQPLQRM